MRRFSWIILLPVAVVVVAFAITNRAPVTLGLWPLEQTYAVPAFVVVLIAVAAGFMLGGLVSWLSAGTTRSRARTLGERAERAEREIRRLRERIERLEADAARAPLNGNALPPPVSPPGEADAA